MKSTLCVLCLFVGIFCNCFAAEKPLPQFVKSIDALIQVPEPNGSCARAEAKVGENGRISAISVTEGGSGYGFTPNILVEPPPEGGTTPIIQCVAIEGGQIKKIQLLSGGSGYDPRVPPQIIVESPRRQAEARAVFSPNALTHIEMVDPGSGYVTPGSFKNPVVNFKSWSGEVLLWVNAVNTSGFSVGQHLRLVDSQSNVHGDGTVSEINYVVNGAPEGSDHWSVRLAGFAGKVEHGDVLEFVDWSFRTYPDKKATSYVGADYVGAASHFEFAKRGQRFPVTGGEGFSTLRGLCPPANGDAVVRALGYYVPGDGGGGVFTWNPAAQAAILRKVIIKEGGEDYRPGDVILLNGKKPLLVTEISKKASTRFPDAQYPDFIGISSNGQVDVGSIRKLAILDYNDLGKVPEKVEIANSSAKWSVTADKMKSLDGPGSGQPFVKGSGDLKLDFIWEPSNGGTMISACDHPTSGRWERLREIEENNILFYGATPSSKDNAWPIQMAMQESAKSKGRPCKIPDGRFRTGTLNINCGAKILGNGDSSELVGMPGEDVFSTIVSPIDFSQNRNSLKGTSYEKLRIVVDESNDATALGGIADRTSYKARRLYNAMVWDMERNSQRWGSYLFLEASPVSDRRYFGTDDLLDPEVEPPINDVEPARRIYYTIPDSASSTAFEFSDRVVETAVHSPASGYASADALAGAGAVTLQGGIPVFGSRVGPSKVGDRSNFGNLSAGKTRVAIKSLFLPEVGKDGFSLRYEPARKCFIPQGHTRTPLLEGKLYSFAFRGAATKADSSSQRNEWMVFHTVCLKDPESNGLVLSLSSKLGSEDAALKMLAEIPMKRGTGKEDAFPLVGELKKMMVTGVVAVRDTGGRFYQPGIHFSLARTSGEKIKDTQHFTNEGGVDGLKIIWKGEAPSGMYSIICNYQGIFPSKDFQPGIGGDFKWVAGPVAAVDWMPGMKLGGSYKLKPGAEAIKSLSSSAAVATFDRYSPNGPCLSFNGKAPVLAGFTVGMAVMGVESGAKGVIKSFDTKSAESAIILDSWNLKEFQVGEHIRPAYNQNAKLGAYVLPNGAGEMALAPENPFRSVAEMQIDAIFASDNPVRSNLTLSFKRGSSKEDLITLDTTSQWTGGKDYYPFRIVNVSKKETDARGGAKTVTFDPTLDFLPTIDSRSQTISLRWSGEWAGHSPIARAPEGAYDVTIEYYSGSPSKPNLPWPEWVALAWVDGKATFQEQNYLAGKGGKIVSKGSNGRISGESLVEGKDYTVHFSPVSGVGEIQFKSDRKPNKRNSYIQIRKIMDDYDREPWGSPKHLSGKLNHAVLVDSFERYMGNFAWIDRTVNYPGYPLALGLTCLNTSFRDLFIQAAGAIQSTSGGIHLLANYEGTHDNIVIRDTNFGFVLPVNTWYPYQNFGVNPDGSVNRALPLPEGDANSAGNWAPDPMHVTEFINNKYQAVANFTPGSEQACFKKMQFRCGDIGMFLVDSSFYEIGNIWLAGANAFDRPRGGIMVFGTPANAYEQFSFCMQAGPLNKVAGEQALNSDYAVPVVRWCAAGGSSEVDFQNVSAGRQVIWGSYSTGRAASGRATVFATTERNSDYGAGIWFPQSMIVSTVANSKSLIVENATEFGQDGRTISPLRHGATYFLHIPGAAADGGRLSASFIYDASKDLNKQSLTDISPRSATGVRAAVFNANVKKRYADDPLALWKIGRHFGWSLMLCGDKNNYEIYGDWNKNDVRQFERLVIDGGANNILRYLGKDGYPENYIKQGKEDRGAWVPFKR